VSSKGLDAHGKPAGRDEVDGYGVGVTGGKGPRESGRPYLDVDWMLCSEPVWPTVAGIVPPKLNRIPRPVADLIVGQVIGEGCQVPPGLQPQLPGAGRFRVHLSATLRGTLVQGTKSTSLSPRQTATPGRPARGVVEVWREPPEAR
jgi:hypothetical protein